MKMSLVEHHALWPAVNSCEARLADGSCVAEFAWCVGEYRVESYTDLLRTVRQMKHFSDN